MTDLINETTNPKQAVLFSCNKVNEVARQFAEMIKYCKKERLHISNYFFETSTIKHYEKECFNQMLEYLQHTRVKTAVIFYSGKEYAMLPLTHKLDQFIKSGQIEIRFMKEKVTISN